MDTLRAMTLPELLGQIAMWLPGHPATYEVCTECGEVLVATLPRGQTVARGTKPHECRAAQLEFRSYYGRLLPNEYIFSCSCDEHGCRGFQVARESGYTCHHVGEWFEEERVQELLREAARRLAEGDGAAVSRPRV